MPPSDQSHGVGSELPRDGHYGSQYEPACQFALHNRIGCNDASFSFMALTIWASLTNNDDGPCILLWVSNLSEASAEWHDLTG